MNLYWPPPLISSLIVKKARGWKSNLLLYLILHVVLTEFKTCIFQTHLKVEGLEIIN